MNAWALAAAAAAAERAKNVLVCARDDVEWSGNVTPECWVCGELGLPKHPNPKEADLVRQYAGERGE